ncbi:MAG: Cof-type HAD-IIB family hydrolase [Clostridium sp.]|uniref:Cof-type HAD-IIB family hydrolase n=1 Tax=Clostridium sp. TaxID=1506 RepID=UPI0025C437D6|nr:Cof-type HAD-IIB family hydrolase [Clostridium sp.]MCF0147078.1 Cof-type HAD-IIB family hydrolase [Clostridium sp.]
MKYLACDLDGTLLREDQTISRENLEAIIGFKGEGNKFVISTGRDVESIYNLFKDYPEIEYDYIVACNGAIVLDKNKEVIFNNYIKHDLAEKIIKSFIDRDDICIHFEADGQHYLVKSKGLEYENSLSEDIKDMLVRFENRISIEDIFAKERKYTFISAFSINKDMVVAEEIKNLLIEKHGQELEAFRNQYFVDIAPKNCSKGNGLRSILKLDNIKEENLYAIGDSFNDVSMFELTKNSFTFHHVEEELKGIAQRCVSTVGECIDTIMN